MTIMHDGTLRPKSREDARASRSCGSHAARVLRPLSACARSLGGGFGKSLVWLGLVPLVGWLVIKMDTMVFEVLPETYHLVFLIYSEASPRIPLI